MKQNLVLSFAVIALIQNASAVSLGKKVTTDDLDAHPLKWNELMKTGKLGEDVNDNDVQHDFSKVQAARDAKAAAEAKKAFEESEWKRKFNPFDGLVHEDNGTSWNKGDGITVGGVNKMMQVRDMPQDEDDAAEQKEKEAEIAANKQQSVHNQKKIKDDEEASNLANWKEEYKNKISPFDGTVHQGDGTRLFPDGQQVRGVNLGYSQRHSHPHHSLAHSRMRKDTEDSMQEQQEKEDAMKANQDQIAANEQQAQAVEAANRAAAQRAFQESEYKRKFNPFDGLIHEDDGRSYNAGDRLEVAGVNRFVKMKNHHNRHHGGKHHHSRVQTHMRREDDDSMEEKDAKQKELNEAKAQSDANDIAAASASAARAASEAAQAAAAQRAFEEREFQRTFSPIDGLLHKDDGKRYTVEGEEVRGVNNGYIQHKRHHHKNHHYLGVQSEDISASLVEKARIQKLHEDKLFKAKQRHLKHQRQRANERKMYEYFNSK